MGRAFRMMRPDLERLARIYGVLSAYRDGFRQERRPNDEALRAVLKDLGAEIDGSDDVKGAIRAAQCGRWGRLVEPVTVSWGSRPAECLVRLPESRSSVRVHATLRTEAGELSEWSVPVASLRIRRLVTVGTVRYAALQFPVARSLPVGYHRLGLRVGGQDAETLLIRAPLRCPSLARTWGVFMPLYALHSNGSPSAGTFRELGALIQWVQDLGGGLVSTLPLLASFLDEPFAPSPYTPVSRQFWNEFYLDLRRVPEWAPQLGGIEERTGGPHVDFRHLMRCKRTALELAATRLESGRRARLLEFVDANPELRAYASFRAGLEKGGPGAVAFDIGDPACLYHSYAQWLANGQIADLSKEATRRGPGLYLDLPLGTHPHGFDSFRHPAVFAANATGGAPPDRFFSKGQDWGFAPINPRQARESGHEYFIASLRHHLQYAGVLRIDHLMGLHRMYWIPKGCDGDEGAYVRYPAEELYAIVCLESTRRGTAVVGEDLGTVPAYVRHCMAERGVRRTYVAQFEFRSDREPPIIVPPSGSVASVNTHDTAMFSAFWSGTDIDDQEGLGLLDEEHAAEARNRRDELREALIAHCGSGESRDPNGGAEQAALRSCLENLSASEADCVIVTLEDLWGETQPQNTPGTSVERPNWTRRGRLGLEGIQSDPSVLKVLRTMNRLRLPSQKAARHG